MTSTPHRQSSAVLDVPKPPDLSWHVQARLPVDYEVVITRGLLSEGNGVLARACGSDATAPTRCLVVIDQTVAGLYGDALQAYFSAWRIEPVWKLVRGDEGAKTLAHAVEITEAMTEMGILRRTEKVVAVGGGVVMDIAGLAASLYRRGVPYIRIPTTLMGQIDAGIGVKTGINHGQHKNRLGTYCAPEATLIDPEFLFTQDQRHVTNGVAEIVKMALVKDAALFELLERSIRGLDAETLASCGPDAREILSRAIAGMLHELAVDFGHTFSPALELRADPPLLHGEAVAVDMAVSLALAHNRGMLSTPDAERALTLMRSAGLPLTHPTFTVELLARALEDTVKHRDGLQRVPLTQGIGTVEFVNDLSAEELARAVAFVAERVISEVPPAAASAPAPAGQMRAIGEEFSDSEHVA
jgi:2-epi-5-epi-valiolone synthase